MYATAGTPLSRVRMFGSVWSVRAVKTVTNREHLPYGSNVSFSLLRLHLIKDGAPGNVRTFRSVRQACIYKDGV